MPKGEAEEYDRQGYGNMENGLIVLWWLVTLVVAVALYRRGYVELRRLRRRWVGVYMCMCLCVYMYAREKVCV